MENTDSQSASVTFNSGEWNGFYLEGHNPNRGWMHLYLEFQEGDVKGEGTDYVGPWVLTGAFDSQSGDCKWVKQYMGKHKVTYAGKLGDNGITGTWNISGMLSGPFHIWPKTMGHFNEMYMTEDLERQRDAAQNNDPFSSLGPSILMDKPQDEDFV